MLSLPPNVDGHEAGHVNLSITSVRIQERQGIECFIKWWGVKGDGTRVIPTEMSADSDPTLATFPIKCQPDAFLQYLSDMQTLTILVTKSNHTGSPDLLGTCSVSLLPFIQGAKIKRSRDIHINGKFSVYSQTRDDLGLLHLRLDTRWHAVTPSTPQTPAFSDVSESSAVLKARIESLIEKGRKLREAFPVSGSPETTHLFVPALNIVAATDPLFSSGQVRAPVHAPQPASPARPAKPQQPSLPVPRGAAVSLSLDPQLRFTAAGAHSFLHEHFSFGLRILGHFYPAQSVSGRVLKFGKILLTGIPAQPPHVEFFLHAARAGGTRGQQLATGRATFSRTGEGCVEFRAASGSTVLAKIDFSAEIDKPALFARATVLNVDSNFRENLQLGLRLGHQACPLSPAVAAPPVETRAAIRLDKLEIRAEIWELGELVALGSFTIPSEDEADTEVRITCISTLTGELHSSVLLRIVLAKKLPPLPPPMALEPAPEEEKEVVQYPEPAQDVAVEESEEPAPWTEVYCSQELERSPPLPVRGSLAEKVEPEEALESLPFDRRSVSYPPSSPEPTEPITEPVDEEMTEQDAQLADDAVAAGILPTVEEEQVDDTVESLNSFERNLGLHMSLLESALGEFDGDAIHELHERNMRELSLALEILRSPRNSELEALSSERSLISPGLEISINSSEYNQTEISLVSAEYKEGSVVSDKHAMESAAESEKSISSPPPVIELPLPPVEFEGDGIFEVPIHVEKPPSPEKRRKPRMPSLEERRAMRQGLLADSRRISKILRGRSSSSEDEI